MERRTTIATTYGLEIARLAERIDRRPELVVAVVDGPDAGKVVVLADSLTIGADPACELVLADERVSARHALIEVVDGVVRVRDLGSTNGLRLQGARVREATLAVGQAFAVGRTSLRVEPRARPARVPPSSSRRFGELVGESLPMRELFAVLELASLSEATVLVLGETGTGKELVARAVHEASPRRKRPFVAIDCGALPEELIDSALFGHTKGAFTGAHEARLGALARAHEGTIFLDEIGNLPLAAQARLLRALETRQVLPVGADREKPIDVRVVAAAPPDLRERVRRGEFRADLYYRIAVVEVELPPLRERLEDLPLLVDEILRRRGLALDGTLDETTLGRLRSHAWPGNVRELRNTLERAVALSPGARRLDELGLVVGPALEGAGGLVVETERPWPEARERLVEEAERRYLDALLARHPGNLSAQARAAGVDRKTLRALLDKHGLGRG